MPSPLTGATAHRCPTVARNRNSPLPSTTTRVLCAPSQATSTRPTSHGHLTTAVCTSLGSAAAGSITSFVTVRLAADQLAETRNAPFTRSLVKEASEPRDDTKVKVRRLSIHYDDFTALSGVDLEIRKNEIFGIIGPANAGKN